MKKTFVIAAVVLHFFGAAGVQAASYSPNFVWQRWYDWTPGSTPGTSIGNPDTDQAGSPVWRAGYLTGGALGSAGP